MIKLTKVNDRYYSPDSTSGKTFSEMDEIQQGYFLTNSQLEQLKREYFDAGQLGFEKYPFGYCHHFQSIEDYEATKKDGEV